MALKQLIRARQKEKFLKICSETSECIWCKQLANAKELTLEHVNRWCNGNTKQHILALSCSKCNAVHGKIMFFFTSLITGQYTLQKYYCELNKFTNNVRFLWIVNNIWFQKSIDKFRNHAMFKYNPSNMSIYKNARVTSILNRLYRTVVQ